MLLILILFDILGQIISLRYETTQCQTMIHKIDEITDSDYLGNVLFQCIADRDRINIMYLLENTPVFVDTNILYFAYKTGNMDIANIIFNELFRDCYNPLIESMYIICKRGNYIYYIKGYEYPISSIIMDIGINIDEQSDKHRFIRKIFNIFNRD